MAEYITTAARGRLAVLSLPENYDDLPFDDDDVAMVLALGRAAAHRNPIVSFWCFATLLSMTTPTYQESRIYWLSAASGVVEMSRRRSNFARCAYVKALSEAAGQDAESLLWIPAYEILLESLIEPRSQIGNIVKGGLQEASNLLARSLPNAVELDRRVIANRAFPILWQSAQSVQA